MKMVAKSAVWFFLSAVGVAQTQQVSSTLAVSGHEGQATVIHKDGRSYVDVEGLARITGATVGFQGRQIVLTLPQRAVVPQQPQVVVMPPQQEPEPTGLSREFLRSGVELMSEVREWRAAIDNAIRTNNPVREEWVSVFRRSTQSMLAHARTDARTESDKKALPLLENAVSMVDQLSARFLTMRESLTFVPTDALDRDPLDQRILACAQGMAAVAIPGAQFEDVPACR
jgi:hypothetical protein